MGFQIIAASADRPQKLAQTSEKVNMTYQLVSDASQEGAKAFGLAYKVDDQTHQRYKKGLGLDLEEASGYSHHILPVPAVYIIGTDGVIRFQYVNPDYRVRLDPDILLAAAQALLKEAGD